VILGVAIEGESVVDEKVVDVQGQRFADTLFERTIAESHNLHIKYPDSVSG
jgi:hypothetical protein